jgi:hypothetical protein
MSITRRTRIIQRTTYDIIQYDVRINNILIEYEFRDINRIKYRYSSIKTEKSEW